MKLTGALLLLGAALLLTSGGNCGFCPDLKEELALFLGSSVSDYVEFVSQYRNESATVEVLQNLKMCADNKMTEEDKENVQSLVGVLPRRGSWLEDTTLPRRLSTLRPRRHFRRLS
ncbi:major allergen I polypeptide chain 1-like [Microtus oregoni]|uniref:major allergen I polypeptide chain 1-like n=1 Tax=Microtus oregoni TaxID=111838 RepID=UPI001BB276AE|nr:major allergen I polypeptide chain 1-like [Microtus oregoni]